jgi:hypothetical protein
MISRDMIDGDVKDGDPAPHVDIFTVGVDGVRDMAALVELADRLGCATVIDARTKLPVRYWCCVAVPLTVAVARRMAEGVARG